VKAPHIAAPLLEIQDMLLIYRSRQDATKHAIMGAVAQFYEAAATTAAQEVNPLTWKKNFSFTAYFSHARELFAMSVELDVMGFHMVNRSEALSTDAIADQLIKDSILLQATEPDVDRADFPFRFGVLHPVSGLTTIEYVSFAPNGGMISVSCHPAHFGNHPLRV
jgi:hypothetical protein